MQTVVKIGDRAVGQGQPVYVIAEIGINHNGSLDLALRMISEAHAAGCDAVKFQKRTPELCVPRDQWNIERDTPWGRMTYIEYRHRVELGQREYQAIDTLCNELGIHWFTSCWDEEAVAFIERHFETPCYKVASASLTDHDLLRAMRATGRPIMLSTGMSSMQEIDAGVAAAGREDLLVAHSTLMYPCPEDALNLRMIPTLQRRFADCPIGYSGHETGVTPTLGAVALGAAFVERHVTLDRRMWGSDQHASLEPEQLRDLVRGIRELERSLGDGVKRVHENEIAQRRKLRRVQATSESRAPAAGVEPSP